MCAYINFVWICLILTIVTASAVPIADSDVLAEFLRKVKDSSPINERVVVKRRSFMNNSDRELKQVSLKSLIDDVETGLFASALNVEKELINKNISVTDNVNNNSENQILPKDNNNSDTVSTTTSETSATLPVTDKMISQTTEVPPSSGIPTHLVIDRIAIEPHKAGLAFIPIFELKGTTKVENNTKDHEITKITISKTEITSLVTSPNESSTSVSHIQPSNPSIELSSEAVTTPKNIEQLKEAEEELKEKVAEIEAEPIILSARV